MPSRGIAAEKDVGTDAYIEHTDGYFSFVQIKYRGNPSVSMYREYISNMALEAGFLLKEKKLKHLYMVTDADSEIINLSDDEIKTYDIKFLSSEFLINMD